MFPVHDDNPTELAPIVTLGIIGVCIAVWIYLQGSGFNDDALGGSICALGAIPAEVTGRGLLRADVVGPCELGGLTWQPFFTSMFLHGSWLHLVGNMWFMWIFGNNIEGYWFLIQAVENAVSGGASGVAYIAHIGGFLTGVVLIALFANPKLVDAKRSNVVLDSSHIERGGWW